MGAYDLIFQRAPTHAVPSVVSYATVCMSCTIPVRSTETAQSQSQEWISIISYGAS